MKDQYKLVPVEPTEEMVKTASDTYCVIGHYPDLGLLKDAISDAIAAAPAQPSPSEPIAWINEDELPENYPYDAMFPYSKVDFVRMFPVYGPSPAESEKEAVRNSALEEAAKLADGETLTSKFIAAQIRLLKSQPAQQSGNPGELPQQSDTDLINWIEEHKAEVRERGANHWEIQWISSDGYTQWTPHIKSLREAIKAAMRADKEGS